ncbi:hypothetical protein SS33_25720, partial [Enterobacter kobei]
MAKVSLAVFVKSAFISRAVLFVVAFAMMSALLLAKPQSSQMSSMQTTEAHQHDNDAGTVAKLAMRQPFVLFKGL